MVCAPLALREILHATQHVTGLVFNPQMNVLLSVTLPLPQESLSAGCSPPLTSRRLSPLNRKTPLGLKLGHREECVTAQPPPRMTTELARHLSHVPSFSHRCNRR